MITAIHHAQITVPPGGEEDARAFYCGVLGLAEIESDVRRRHTDAYADPAPKLADLGFVRYRKEGELHAFRRRDRAEVSIDVRNDALDEELLAPARIARETGETVELVDPRLGTFHVRRLSAKRGARCALDCNAAALPLSLEGASYALGKPNERELERYGLKSPRLRAAVTTKEGDAAKELTYSFGNETG